MVSYKEKTDLGLSVITTFSGDKEYRKNCKFIKEQYYVINRDCFNIEGKWRRIDDINIVFDNESKQYVLKTAKNLRRGIVQNGSKLELGYFIENPYNNIPTSSDFFGKVIAISEEILGNEWFEDMKEHVWYLKKEHSTANLIYRKQIQNHENPSARGYNIEDNEADYRIKTELYENYNTHITPKIKALARFIGNLSFGFEFELHQGMLPNHLQNRYGIVPCRDGSLNGGMELPTVPMIGAKGLQTVVNLCDDLKSRGIIDISCSLHIHFGNIGTDKLSIVSLYRLCRNLQDELFTMFPHYKIAYQGIKQKNYTKKLPKLNIGVLKDISKAGYETYLLDSWNKLFNYYCEDKMTLATFNKRTRKHPVNNKWEQHSRYNCFNFLNLFFTHRHTLEARLSGATLNKNKVINWMLICVAIIKYSEKYAKEIITSAKTISLKEILEIYPTIYPNDKGAHFLSQYLYNYFKERQERFKADFDKGDYISAWDIKEDKDYTYQYMNVNLLE